MLIAMAGLPGTGKSTLARQLAQRLGATLLCKDEVRAAMFPVVEYSRQQDDAVMAAIYAEARRVLEAGKPVIIDGRTFSRGYQLRDLLLAVEPLGIEPRIIECVAAEEVVRKRLETDSEAGSHPAKNRNFALYLKSRKASEPLTIPRLTIDTGQQALEDSLGLALEYLAKSQQN